MACVGGKKASLGEMLRNLSSQGVRVPPGFVTTASAYWEFVRSNKLDQDIGDALAGLSRRHAPLAEVGETKRRGAPAEETDAGRRWGECDGLGEFP
jgi:pyruvate,water dikinase